MVQTQLQLSLAPAGCGLFHPAQLRPEVIAKPISEPDVRSVAIEVLNPALADARLSVNENFIVQRKV